MRFLIDEDVPLILADWIRSQGHDVLLASEVSSGQPDRHWLAIADQDERIIITADKDFGELVFRDRLTTHGIILLRFFDLLLEERLARLKEVWSVIEANPTERFTVITTKRIRVRPMI